MLKEALTQMLAKQSLSESEAAFCMEYILSETADPIQVAAFLGIAEIKGTEKEELLGYLKAMWSKMRAMESVENVVDICGTGGDMLGSFNISTAAALVVSAAGAKVAKCGNRSSSSSCGSADLLEAAGIRIDLPSEQVKSSLAEHGFAFLFTPHYHPSVSSWGPHRRSLGFRTIFNLMGPLGNPLQPTRRLMGVSNALLAPLYAEILASIQTDHALVAHGMDGMDEISLCAPTVLYEIKGGSVSQTLWEPDSIGLTYVDIHDLKGGTVQQNKEILHQLFEGSKRIDAIRKVTCVNAGAALMISGYVDTIREGYWLAEETIASGKAGDKLHALVQSSNMIYEEAQNYVHAK
ncbi:anthranilate phosphoribosyltransferase [Paenibacillus shirakamiensis]|uniref:Anthranilate phosphoribosyltransferase n=1 Tax=Paenibacillus shirakamiensis TaxID=1265935 RepID=A0ABS4JEZ1_9BACL|nr:anthranilate phosphoribosyltransferase [Paenibacillus shirakamiensis]MBP2000272.1 anthranilate phosphoribosyltransferase [Paenibacillus shirakamiensis]